MSRVARTSRLVLGILAGLAVAAAATGWLYLFRPVGLPGPQIGQALPLDALARRSGVSLLLFAAVWWAAGLGLGLIARAVRAERLTSALLLALGVGLWSYLQTGVSILIVQQVPAHEAFRTAAGLRAVYLPAALVGLAGALTGHERRTVKPRAPLLLACAVAVTGGLGVLDAILPERPDTLLSSLALSACTRSRAHSSHLSGWR